MKLLLCKCSACKQGRKHRHRREVEDKAQGAKSRVRSMLKGMEYDKLPVAVRIGYTD